MHSIPMAWYLHFHNPQLISLRVNTIVGFSIHDRRLCFSRIPSANRCDLCFHVTLLGGPLWERTLQILGAMCDDDEWAVVVSGSREGSPVPTTDNGASVPA